MSKKVSIIVPAYNSHDTLARCLGSLVHQTLEDIEIIVINDASTDDTWEIMKRCEAQFPGKVIIIDGEENRKSGGARNQGFNIASGEYIGLVDSDDYIASEMYEKLYIKAKEGDYDIVDCGYYSEANDKATIFTGDNVTGMLDDFKRRILISNGGYLVTKIFRRELFNDPVIRMREHIRCLEDTEIMIYMFLRAKSIGNVKEVLYSYCNNAGSATKTMDLDTYVESVYGAIEATFDKCHELPTYEGAREAVEYAMTNMYSFGVTRCLYDRIRTYGAKEGKTGELFSGVGEKEADYLSKLTTLIKRVSDTSFRDNKEIRDRIPEIDIEIMEECIKRY